MFDLLVKNIRCSKISQADMNAWIKVAVILLQRLEQYDTCRKIIASLSVRWEVVDVTCLIRFIQLIVINISRFQNISIMILF